MLFNYANTLVVMVMEAYILYALGLVPMQPVSLYLLKARWLAP